MAFDAGEHPLFSGEFRTKTQLREIKKRYKPRPKKIKQSREYYAKNPQPNYSDFGNAQFIDSDGREYKVAKGPFLELQEDHGVIVIPGFKTPSTEENQSWGSQVMWCRVPTALRGTVNMLRGDEGSILLYHLGNQVECYAVVENVVGTRKATRAVIFNSVISTGQAADPSKWIPMEKDNLHTHIVKKAF